MYIYAHTLSVLPKQFLTRKIEFHIINVVYLYLYSKYSTTLVLILPPLLQKIIDAEQTVTQK